MGKRMPFSETDAVLLSLIIPVYNGSKHLAGFQNTIERVPKDCSIQIVVVDDASTDGTPDVLAQVLKASGLNFCLQVIEKNVGPGGARNVGRNNALGRYVAFVDFDDEFSVNGFLSLAMKLKEYSSNVGIARYEAIIHNRRHAGSNDYQVSQVLDARSRVLSQVLDRVAPWRYVYERKWLLEHNLDFPESKPGGGEDLLFLVKVDQANPKVVVSEDIIYRYFLGHTGQMSTSKFDSEPRIFLLRELACQSMRYQSDWEKVIIAEWFFRTWMVWIRNPTNRRNLTIVRYLGTWWTAGNSSGTLLKGIFVAYRQHRRWKRAWMTRPSNTHKTRN